MNNLINIKLLITLIFTQDIRTKRVLEAYGELKRIGKISKQKDLCDKIKYDYSNFSQIKNGKRDLPDENIRLFVSEYHLNESFINEGKYPIVKENDVNDDCEKLQIEIQRLQKEVRILEKVIDLKEKMEPPEGVMERLTRLEYSMKYVLKFISNEHEYRRSLRYIDVPLNDMSICISNAEGKLEYVNDEFTNQTGYTLDEVLGKKPGDVLQGKKTERKVVGSISEAIKSRKRFEGEIINYNKMGDEITCKLIIAPMLDRNGQVEKLISLAIFIK